MIHQNVRIRADLVAAVCRHYRVKELAVFGSALRADFGPKSDIDVLVTFEPDAEIGFIALSNLQRELTRAFGRKVDLVPKDGLKPVIRKRILDEAEIVYAA